MAAVTIALDAMGGDRGLDLVIPAALNALESESDLNLVLVGDADAITQKLQQHDAEPSDRLRVHHASEVVSMDEAPSHALRNKKDSSIRVAIDLVKDGKVQACVSAGNTGALMATARFVLKTIPGVDRPAIISEVPSVKNKVRVLDLGANVDSCAEHLVQFAVMGSELISAVDHKKNPTVGLLNIGVEEMKGNDQVKRTAQLLTENKVVNYVGYVEADEINQGTVDLFVCDGFVGNVALKSSEGIAKLFLQYLNEGFSKSVYSRFVGGLVSPILSSLRKRYDPARYNGATMLGLNGIVVKSHGGTSVVGYECAIKRAILEVRNDVPKRIGDKVASILQDGTLL